ncbi:MAG TPA: AAA family ATPase [Xanthobacteraceae bacterium]|nr:AAA family ATPase [Xanthobacteraceae bacterium]
MTSTDLTGYAFETLRTGNDFSLFRGRRAESHTSILVLLPASVPQTPENRRALENEYALAKELNSDWAVLPLALTRHDGSLALVLEDKGGDPLLRSLGQPLDLEHFLTIALSATSALRHAHLHGFIHKRIEPGNIIVDPAGKVRLTGFGAASRLSREFQPPVPAEIMTGPLAYMAPEQTGRMNRSIDARSDLYSLGITFYQMLTGTLPFSAADPMEWIHCHIARPPPPLSGRVAGIPDVVADIVLKLLAKNAEDRYQTAAGVEADLKRCLQAWRTHHSIESFPLAVSDASDRLRMPEKLYGREPAIEALVTAFDRVVARGTTEFVLVSGHAGIGKSHLVNELHKTIASPLGLFAAGKFDQYKRNIPYATIAQALQSLVRQLLGLREAELEPWRQALLDAVGQNGSLIVNLIPELELVIGEQLPLSDSDAQDTQDRFQAVFRRVLGVFARAEHPLVLFLDDLQWIDRATVDLVQHIVTHEEVGHLLLIGAYRDNEVDASHALVSALDTVRSAGAPVRAINLAPLTLGDVERLLADTLQSEAETVAQLALLVHERAGGNPFFTSQFVGELAADGLVAFDDTAAAWTWDLPKIRGKNYTDNVVDLLIGKLGRLPHATREALKWFACLGNTADFSTLAAACEKSPEQLHMTLWDAAEVGLVLRLDGTYKFLHDRVQEAAYALIPQAERPAAHLRIGRLLEQRISVDALSEHIFEIVNHLNRAAALIDAPGDRTRLAELNLIAGRRAKAAAAYISALTFYTTGIALLPKDRWQSCYPLSFALELDRTECEYLNGNLENAGRLVATLQSVARSNLDKAAICRFHILFHVAKAEYRDAIEQGLACLRLFGIAIAPSPSRLDVQKEYESIWINLGDRPIEDLVSLPLVSDPEMQAALRVLTFVYSATSFTNNNLFYMLICRGANLTLRHGTTEVSTHIYSGLAQTLGPVFHRYEDGIRFGKLACAVAERFGFVGAKSYFAMECASVWSRPIQTAIDFIRLTFRIANETSDLAYAGYASMRLITDLLLQGTHLDEVWSQSQRSLEFESRINFRDLADVIISQRLFISNLRDRTNGLSDPVHRGQSEKGLETRLTPERAPTLVCWHWILKLQSAFIFGDFELAQAAADKAASLLWATEPFIQYATYCYYRLLTLAARHETPPEQGSVKGLGELYEHLAQLREWADACHENFAHKYALAMAEIARLENRELDAERLYEEAIRLARTHGFVQDEACANEVAARFYAGRGFDTIANAYLRNSRFCYLQWGAKGKVEQLDQLHPHLRQDTQSQLSGAATATPGGDLDLATVIKVSQAVSGEINIGRLIETLMTIALEHAGATRGMLVLPRQSELHIEAEATIAGGAVKVIQRGVAVSPLELSESILQSVVRTQQSILIDDAIEPNAFSADHYIRNKRPRSVLCIPLIKQTRLIGVLYLENNEAAHVFTPSRISILQLLASQAAISLENAQFYADAKQREDDMQKLVSLIENSNDFIGFLASPSKVGFVNAAGRRLVGLDLDEDLSDYRAADFRSPEEQRRFKNEIAPIYSQKGFWEGEGTLRHFKTKADIPIYQTIFNITEKGTNRRIAAATIIRDLSERKRFEQTLQEMRDELAHVGRVTTLGELAASIAHEVNQPLAAIQLRGESGLRFLEQEPPAIERLQRSLGEIISDARRAGNIIHRIRELSRKTEFQRTMLDINTIIDDVLPVIRVEVAGKRITLCLEQASELPAVVGDRVQLQQVVINLVVNGIEAIESSDGGSRQLTIGSQTHDDGVMVFVRDSGAGIAEEDADKLFDAFFTTKRTGVGMGLSICRSILETHGGRIWALRNEDHSGSTFNFVIPAAVRNV